MCISIRWVEEDPKEIIQSVYECIERTCEKLRELNVNITNIKGVLHRCPPACGRVLTAPSPSIAGSVNRNHLLIRKEEFFTDIYVPAFLSAVGVTNQRETTVVWDKETGEPLSNAIGEFTLCHSERCLMHIFTYT